VIWNSILWTNSGREASHDARGGETPKGGGSVHDKRQASGMMVS